MNLVHFPRAFYEFSSTSIGTLYHEDGRRADWGKVELTLAAGESVTIRPATKPEKEALLTKTFAVIDEMAQPERGFIYGYGNYEALDDRTRIPLLEGAKAKLRVEVGL